MDNYLKTLNKNQFEAVTFTNGPALVIAGPGSGKTRVLTYRVARLLENGISPTNICLLTFTNKAANEMLSRINELDIYETDKTSEFYDGEITACTYHSFAVNILRKYAKYINYNSNFTIIDRPDTLDIISLIFEENNVNRKQLKESVILKIFNDYLNGERTLKEIIEKDYDLLDKYNLIKKMYEEFQQYKINNNLMSYTDLLYYLYSLLRDNETICKNLSDKYKYIMVDEYQDSNYLQFKIIKELRKFKNKNIMVVGDDFQSIYSFNYSDIKNILNFSSFFEKCTVIKLSINYRSNQEIVNVCNNIILSGTEKLEKDLKATYSKGIKPNLIEFKTKEDECDFIIDKIKEYKRNGEKLKDMVVLIRNSRDSTNLEVLLNKQLIPYQKFGGRKFLEKKYVKEIFSYLKLTINEKDELSWLKTLTIYPNIGYKLAKNISNDVSKNGLDILLDKKYEGKKSSIYIKEVYNLIIKLKSLNLQEQLKFLLDKYYFNLNKKIIESSNKLEKIKLQLLEENDKNKKESLILFDISKDYKSTSKFLTDIVLEAPSKNNNEDYLTISTIHSAKGLEYKIGFVLDCVDGIIPVMRQQTITFKEEEEERRVFYVAVSRIKEDLYVLYPRYIFSFKGYYEETELSRFLDENNTYKLFNKIKKS